MNEGDRSRHTSLTLLASRRPSGLDEACKALLALSLGDVDDPSSPEIVEEGHVPMTFLHRELVHGQPTHEAEIDVLPGFVDVVLQDPPDTILIDMEVASIAGHRHLVAQRHDHGLDVQREPRVRPGPRQLGLPDAMLSARRPGNAGVEIRIALEEVQMPLCALRGIMHPAHALAFGAGEPRSSFEVDEDVQSLIAPVQLRSRTMGPSAPGRPGRDVCRP